MLRRISLPISATVATAVVVVLVAMLYPRGEAARPSSIEPVMVQSETAIPVPTDFPSPEGFINPDLPPLPASWNEASAVAYTKAWLAWRIPGFTWASADARKTTQHVLEWIDFEPDLTSIPTLPPLDQFTAVRNREFWLVIFSLDEPMREGVVSAALHTAMGIDDGMAEDRLFTRGYAKLVESGNFTSFGVFDYIDEAGKPTLFPHHWMPSAEAILALPTQAP